MKSSSCRRQLGNGWRQERWKGRATDALEVVMEQEQEVSRLEGRKCGGVSAGRWAAINRGNQSGDIVHSESTEYIALRVWSSISWSIE